MTEADNDDPCEPEWPAFPERRKSTRSVTDAAIQRMVGTMWADRELELAQKLAVEEHAKAAEEERKTRLAARRATGKALLWILIGAVISAQAPPWWMTAGWHALMRAFLTIVP